MAYNNQAQAPAFVLTALILFAAANPLAHAQLISSLLPNVLNVGGLLCCTATGNCTAGAAGIAGVPVSLNCSILGATVTVGRTTTGANGAFNIGVSNLLSTLGLGIAQLLSLNSLPCNVAVQLPLNQTLCPILSTVNGVITGVPSVLNSIVSGVGGLVANLTVPKLSVSATIG